MTCLAVVRSGPDRGDVVEDPTEGELHRVDRVGEPVARDVEDLRPSVSEVSLIQK